MNTEILDYIKELSKKEFFLINVINTALSIIIILCAAFSLKSGATNLSYTIMFACASGILATNSYKCFKRESKNGWVLAFFTLIFLAATGLCVYSLLMG